MIERGDGNFHPIKKALLGFGSAFDLKRFHPPIRLSVSQSADPLFLCTIAEHPCGTAREWEVA